jgi:hypothetical protein
VVGPYSLLYYGPRWNELLCTCTAGQQQMPCCHAAAVIDARRRRAPIGPAPFPRPQTDDPEEAAAHARTIAEAENDDPNRTSIFDSESAEIFFADDWRSFTPAEAL